MRTQNEIFILLYHFCNYNSLTLLLVPKSNSNHQNPLVVAYAKLMVHVLVTGKNNPRIEPKILNLIRFIDTIIPKATDIVSANLSGGQVKHWMWKLNKQERKKWLVTWTLKG